jgi:hypothetical protein
MYILTLSGISLFIAINIIATIKLRGILNKLVVIAIFLYLFSIYIRCIINLAKVMFLNLVCFFIRNGGLTPTMEMGVMNAIPIWEMLNITERQYQLDYEFKAFQKNEEAITELVKEVFDTSMGVLKE